MKLRDLDARFVPRLAAGLRALLDGASTQGARLAGRGQALLTPSPADRLRRLDDRFASTGPLSLLRDVPQLGLLVVAAVFLAGAGLALARSTSDDAGERRPGQRANDVAAGSLTLGPPVGATIEDHFATAREQALALAEDGADEPYLALVSLSDERTAAEVQQLADQNDLRVRRVYLRAPVGGEPEVMPVEISGGLSSTITAVLAETARRKTEEQREFVMLAESIEPASEEEAEFKRFYEQAARTAGEEAAAYAGSCSCVFALVVEAPAADLVALTALPAVRGVELAPQDAELPALDVRPLPPDTTGVVPEERTVVGGS